MTKKDIDKLVQEFMEKPKVTSDNSSINKYKLVKPNSLIKDKANNKVVHENNSGTGGTIIHGENAQIINNKVIDYKIDNTAIDNGRASIGLRKRGDRVNPVNMSPKEFKNFLFYEYKIPGKSGWNGIERSDFAQNWEADESQIIKTRDEALNYLGISETLKAPDGIEKRSGDRRKKQPDIRKNKTNRRKAQPRRKVEKQNKVLDSIVHVLTFIICISVYLILWSIAS